MQWWQKAVTGFLVVSFITRKLQRKFTRFAGNIMFYRDSHAVFQDIMSALLQYGRPIWQAEQAETCNHKHVPRSRLKTDVFRKCKRCLACFKLILSASLHLNKPCIKINRMTKPFLANDWLINGTAAESHKVCWVVLFLPREKMDCSILMFTMAGAEAVILVGLLFSPQN